MRKVRIEIRIFARRKKKIDFKKRRAESAAFLLLSFLAAFFPMKYFRDKEEVKNIEERERVDEEYRDKPSFVGIASRGP